MRRVTGGNTQFNKDYAKCTTWLQRYYTNGETVKDPKWYSHKNVGIFTLYNTIIELYRVQDKIEKIKEYYKGCFN